MATDSKTKKTPIRLWGLYKDKGGNVWRVIENLYFGRWIIKRTDRTVIGQSRSIDMQNSMEYVGQSEPDAVVYP